MALSPLQLLARRPILNTASSSSLGRFAGRRTAAAAGSSSLASHRLQQRWLSSSGAAAMAEPLADPLHYHPLPADSPRLLALSFIDRPPISAQSRTTIGHLPLFADGREPSLADFVENAAFKDVLHETIREAISEGDERIVAEAQGRVEGWINLTDDRNPGLPSRVGDADDLIGSFYVTEGKADAKTYAPMPAYRVLTPDGPTTLSESMMARLRARLVDVWETETREAAASSSSSSS